MSPTTADSSQAPGASEQRKEPRLPIDSLVLPFLGSREVDHQSFQYLIEDISVHGARILLPNWVISRERLRVGEVINLHLPFRLGQKVFDQGGVLWSRWDDSLKTQVCGLQLSKAAPHFQVVYFDLSGSGLTLDLQRFRSPRGLAARVLKDSFLLKKGISIYLSHLIPYFSRVGDYPRQDFEALKKVFLAGLQEQVLEHQERLAQLNTQVLEKDVGSDERIAMLDLEELRGLSESELSQDVLTAAFTSPMAAKQIAAIKTLEKRLHANFNTLVMLYLRAMGEA